MRRLWVRGTDLGRRLLYGRRLGLMVEAWKQEVDREPFPEMDIVLRQYYSQGGEDGQGQSEGRPRQEGPPEEEEPMK